MSIEDILKITACILASLGGGVGIVFGFSNWLGKLWADRALESFRAGIRREAFQSEVRFTRLHEKRAEVIADLFTKLVALVDAADQHLIGPRVDSVRHKHFAERHKEFVDSFERNQIYFAAELCESLSSFTSKLRQADMEKWNWQDCPPQTDEDRADWKARNMKRWNLVTEEVPVLKTQLTEEFRRLLGVHLYANASA